MKLNKITIAITLLAGSSMFAALVFNGSQMTPPQEKGPETSQNSSSQIQENVPLVSDEISLVAQLQQVAVVSVTADRYTAEVIGYGEAKSRYELNFTAEVSGRVNTVSQQFESGQVIKKGAVIASIDATTYQQALSQAKANVAQAQLDLLEEQRQGEQAKSEWQRSGLTGEPDSPLVLRAPQLTQVKAALENAKLERLKAEQDLEKTQIKAPFDALVVTRDIQPGSYVQAGTQVATLYSVDEVEIAVPLSESQWNSLPSFDNQQLKEASWPVTLFSSDGEHQWQGYVERVEQHLSQDTRQRSLVVVVEKPLEQGTALYPGTFLKTSITGKSFDQLWQLPASSVSQQGELWFVDQNDQLVKSSVSTQFEKEGFVYVSASQFAQKSLLGKSFSNKSAIQVVKRPLSSFQAGMIVFAKEEG